jgi:hypothetical protein
MNYFRCKVCGKLNDLDSDFCDIYHLRYWLEYHKAFHKWLQRGTPLLDYAPTEDWEQSFLPLDDKRAILPPHMGGDHD